MKVLFLEGDINNAVRGFRQELVARVAKTHDVAICGADAYGAGREVAAPIEGVTVYNFGKSTGSLANFALLIVYVCRTILRFRPDVVFSFNLRSNMAAGIAALIFRRPAYVATVTGLGVLFDGGSRQLGLLRRVYRYVSRRFIGFFFQNTADLEVFRSAGFHLGEYRVVPGSGVDIDRFRPTSAQFSPKGAGRFIFIGRLVREKGVFEFIAAAEAIRRSNPDAVFDVLGPMYAAGQDGGKDIPAIQEAFNSGGAVRYLGATDDIAPFVEEVDCVVLPSYREGMSNVLMESASLAKPIITSDVPGCREIVEDSVTGSLCRPRDSDDLERKIRGFLELDEDERRLMGARGREKMMAGFDRRRTVAAYLEYMDSMVRAR